MTFAMRKLVLVPALAAAAGTGFAQEFGRVLSSSPITQQIGVPRQICSTEQVLVAQPKSGAGAALGAIAGGALANAAAHGAGQAAATMIGIMGGAVIGDRIEGPATAQVQNVQRCVTQTVYENRTLAYNVVYEYAGKQYTVQMPRDPGPNLQLQVMPVGSAAPAAAPDNYLAQGPVTYAQAGPVIVTPTPPASVYLDIGWGYWGGHRGRSYWR